MRKTILSLIRKIDDLVFGQWGSVSILFVIRNSFGFNCQLPVLRALEKKSGININLTFDREDCFIIPEDGEIKGIFEKYFISPEKAVWKKWNFVVATDFMQLYLKRHHTKIVMAHGPGFGNANKSDHAIDYMAKIAIEDGYHVSFLISHAACEYAYKMIPILKVKNDKAIFVTGFPKVDDYFNGIKSDRVQYLQSIGLSPEKKTIVIFSHWTEYSLFRNLGFELVKRLIQPDQNYNIIINGHEKLWFDPGSPNGPSAPSHLYDSLMELQTKVSNLYFMDVPKNFKSLLESADLFIADYSSIFLECCIMDKPIMFYQHKRLKFQDDEVGELYKAAAAFSFDTISDICKLCTKALENPDMRKLQRKELVNFFLDHQGESAQYIADLLMEMGCVFGPSSSGWKRVKQLSHQNLLSFNNDHISQ